MKHLLKFVLYSVAVVALGIGFIVFFRDHPEVQLAFLVPGIFCLLFSKIRDEVFGKTTMRLRMVRGR